MTVAWGADDLEALERHIDHWLAELSAEADHIVAVDRDTESTRRWFVRMRGDEKDFTTVWLTLGQRTLRYETFVMPAPEENSGALYENLLRRNDPLVGAHFAIGVEDAVFLRGEMPIQWVTHAEVDRILGTLYAQVELCFGALLRLGFASRFAT